MADPHSTDEAPGGNTRDADDQYAEEDLLQILCLKLWTDTEALFWLNGIDLEQSDYTEQEGHSYVFLPHGRLPEWEGLDSHTLEMNVQVVLDRTERFIAVEPGPDVRTPQEWLTLAAENGHTVHWEPFARSRPRLRQYLPGEREDLQARVGALEAENRELTAKLERARALEGQELISALKMIAGIATDKYGWHPHTPQPDVVKLIVGSLQRAGYPLADNTVRKFLRLAAKLLLGS